jgi:hypothetical protein
MEVLRVAAVDRSITYGNGDSTGTVRTVFKGGTSLSRVHGLIDRFSEDVDLLVLFPITTADRAQARAMECSKRSKPTCKRTSVYRTNAFK